MCASRSGAVGLLLRSSLFLTGFLCVGGDPALGQESAPTPPELFVGIGVLLAQPTGEFADNVGSGFGVDVWGRVFAEPGDRVSLRGDLGFINYGNETIGICITQPCRVTGELTTSNNIFFGGLGPELGVGTEVVRLYAHASLGFVYFATTSSVEGSSDDGDPFASSTNFDDLGFSWMAGGGGQLRLFGGATPVHLDLGARYHGNGDAEYLRKGDIEDLPDGSVRVNPRRSDTNLWTIRLGVAVGLGGAPSQ